MEMSLKVNTLAILVLIPKLIIFINYLVYDQPNTSDKHVNKIC